MNNLNDANKVELINFSLQPKSKKNYKGGSMKKIGIFYQNNNYMVKIQEKQITHYAGVGFFNPTYISSVFSEYIASNIALNLGLKAHKTLIGYVNINKQKRKAVACKDFLKENEELIEFNQIASEVLELDFNENITSDEKKYNTDYEIKTLSKIISVIEKQKYINPFELKLFFWKQFVFDAYIGNFDRNSTNWGIIKNVQTNECRIAPIFDNGSCLHPKTPRKLIKEYLKKINQNESYLKDFSIFNLTMNFKNQENRRINYGKFFKESEDLYFLFAVKELFPIIVNKHKDNIDIIKSLTNVMEEERVELLIKELDYRLEKMFKPVYEKTLLFNKKGKFIPLEIEKGVLAKTF